MKTKIVLIALVLTLAVGAVATFYNVREFTPVATGQPGTLTPEPAPGQPAPGSGQPTPAPDVAVSKMVVSDEGGISVVMSIEPEQQTAEHVVISLFINTHGGDLSKYNLARLTSVQVDGAPVDISGIKFTEPNPGDPHHRSGSLLIPRTTDGRFWLGEDTAKLQLVVNGVPKGTKRDFAWASPWQIAGYKR